MQSKDITVIMPALNEERCLEPSAANVLAAFARFGLAGELLIVNDGSGDRTGAVAEELAGRHGEIRVLHHATPRGIGAAFRSGLGHARGELIVYIPGDGEIDAAEILQYAHLMDKVEMVVPFVRNPEIRRRSRRLLSSCYTVIMGRTFGVSLKYLNGTVLYRTAILEGITLRNEGFLYQAELLIKAVRKGHRYAEVPYRQQPRLDGRSKSVTLRSLKTVLAGYLGMVAEIRLRRADSRAHPLALAVKQ